MATIQKRSRINRWAGPLSDITEAGKLVVSTLSDWTGHDPECEVEIAFPNATRRDHLMEMLDRRVDTRDMSSISSIRVRVEGHQGPFGIVHLETSEPMSQNTKPAVTLEVTGADESQVDALLEGLRRIFRRGSQSPEYGLLLLMVVAAGVSFVALAIGLPEWLGYELPDESLAGAGVAIGILVALIGVVVVGSLIVLHPVLELLPPGGKTRRARWSSRVWSVLGLLLSTTIGVFLSTSPSP